MKHILDNHFLCGIYDSYYFAFLRPFRRSAMHSCGLLTAALAVTRFISIYKPIQSRLWLTSTVNWVFAISLSVVPLLINLRYVFIYKVSECCDKTEMSTWNAAEIRSSISRSTFFEVHRALVVVQQCFCMYVTWFAIAAFNILLLVVLHRARKRRQCMSSNYQHGINFRLAILLLCITMSYCILIIPTSMHTIVFFAQEKRGYPRLCTAPQDQELLRMIYGFRLLRTLHSCLNFVWFVAFGSEFRKEMIDIMCGWKKHQDNSTELK